MPGAVAPFELGGDERGVLCVHGFTGTPFEMRYLGERLHAELGCTVIGPALPGHNATPEALDRTTWRDWADGVDAAFTALRARCSRVAVVGQSLGGLLALHLAAHRPDEVAAAVSLAAPLWLPRAGRAVVRLSRALPGLRGRRLLIPKAGGSDVRDRAMKAENPSYPVLPLRALGELDDFTRVVRGELARVRAPVLIVHARRDHTAPYAGSLALLRELGSATVRHRALPESFHLIAIDVERDQVAAEVGRFLTEHLVPGAPARCATSSR